MANSALDEAIRAVSRFLVADATVGETLERIATLAKDSIGKASAAGITLLDDDRRPVTVVYTDELSPAIDRSQYDEKAGPCLDAYEQSRIIRVDDTREAADRWPAFSRRAEEHGILSTLSIPLAAEPPALGALNLYAPVEGGFDDDDVAGAEQFGVQAAVVVANTRSYWDAFELSEGLHEAMRSRATIEQAKGILMAQHRCSAEEAFAILTRASQRANVKLREVAQRLVEAGGTDADPHS
ncbi:MAG TPA: GAF and ANTAR domain-containing protein [Acidimicrobiia bacterium]|nr:GAF and ANTAR domain-containing protein [Acidimicrobiia bacterium]